MKKIPTIFVRNPENMKEILPLHNPECEWVFQGEGIATRKYDGACCKIEKGKLWKRREIKQGQLIPDAFVEEHFDFNTGKRVGWMPVSTVRLGNCPNWKASSMSIPKRVKYTTRL